MKKSMFLLFFASIFVIACSSNEKKQIIENKDEFNTLVEYVETNANILDNGEFPFFLLAPEVYQGIRKNFLIIDVRPQEAFEFEHIQNSVNILPNNLIDYFQNSINPASFDTIALICYTGQTSTFCTAGLRLLGYNNVYSIKHGFAAWDLTYANEYKFKDISNLLIDELKNEEVEKRATTKFPKVETIYNNAYEILLERVKHEFEQKIGENFVKIEEILNNPEKYYLISYVPKEIYLQGHLPNSINYEPKNPFTKKEFLNTLPLDKTIIIDCYNGIQSSAVIMYLRVLGYDAKNIYLGENSYMYDKVVKQGMPGRYFSEKDIFNYPLSKTETVTNTDETPKKVVPKGGC